MIHATLMVHVAYDEASTDAEEVRKVLRKAADFLAANGLLSNNTNALVDSWAADVFCEDVPRSQPSLFDQAMKTFYYAILRGRDIGLSLPDVSREQVLAATVQVAIAEIEADIAKGILPLTVASYADLNNRVDANGYGRAFEWPGPLIGDAGDEQYVQAHCDFWTEVQNRVQKWLQTRGKGNEHERTT